MSTSNRPRRIPGPQSRKLSARLKRVESRNVTFLSDEFPVFWESASGSRVRDVDGNSYLDLTSAFGVMNLGHNPPAVRKAILSQSKKMWHGMGDVHPNRAKVELLEALSRATQNVYSKTILSSSGSEAVESALKTARLKTGKRGVIAFDRAYHGLSYGTLGITDRQEFQKPFQNQLPVWCTHLPFPDLLHLRQEEKCLEILELFLRQGNHPSGPFGAMIVEPIQGRGGVRPAGATFMKGLAELAKRFDMLLIADEVFTGIGRTGQMLASSVYGVAPDLVCVGKALSNGFPLSACLGKSDVMDAWPPSEGEAIHTSTFLGNPLGCAMAVATLKEMTQKHLPARARRMGQKWIQALRDSLGDHPHVAEVRGMGLLIGIELVKSRATLQPHPLLTGQIVMACLKEGLIVLSGGTERNVLTLTPPLTVTERELIHGTDILTKVLKKCSPQPTRSTVEAAR